MQKAGKLAADVLTMLKDHVRSGVTTDELDKICHEFIVNEQKAIPAPLNYRGFPKSICTSVNYVVCHGIPNQQKLKKGDILNIDITVIKDGFHGDTSKMFVVDETSNERKNLIKITQQAMYMAIAKVKNGAFFSDIGKVIHDLADTKNYGVVRDFCGHGLGENFHEDPQILHFRNDDKQKMKTGMCFTIEPMINLGTAKLKVLKDGWTAVTKDRKDSAQFEHSLCVTDDGFEIFTLRDEESLDDILQYK